MTLIASISGIRGTIGGKTPDALTPIDIQKYSLAYGLMLLEKKKKPKVIIGRDARISGEMVYQIVSGNLIGLGIDVVNLGLSTTPTVEKAVTHLNADGGIILTASHNPKEWNALKLLNEKGEFISAEDGTRLLELAKNINEITFPDVDNLGKISYNDDILEWHIEQIVSMKWIDRTAIEKKKLKIAVDGINSSGSIAVPLLLQMLGVNEIFLINPEPNGDFAHNPEPLAPHLKDICQKVVDSKADMGIVVDPDVDRLCFVNQDGSLFGEEYTLVAVADYILSMEKGSTVSNLSSTRALRDVTRAHGCEYFASAVGEVNVVSMMKEKNAIIGGEGNGGVIFPASHYGRDALMGIALFLSYYAQKNETMTKIRASLPQYYMSKNKIELTTDTDVDKIIDNLYQRYKDTEDCNTIDGLKIDFKNGWVHLRKSNTEPIIRVYSEATSPEEAEALAHKIMKEVGEM